MFTNHPLIGVNGGFHKEGERTDKTETGLTICRVPGIHGPQVPYSHLGSSIRLLPWTNKAQRSFEGYPDPGAACLFQAAYPGANFGTILGSLSEYPKYGQCAPSTNDILMENITRGSMNPANQPLDKTQAQLPPKEETRSDTKVKRPQFKPYIPTEQNSYKPYYGASPDEKEGKWEQHKNIPTAETPFNGLLNKSMLSGLPGQIMSIAKSFAGLSSGQKQKIQQSVSEETYKIIESVMSSTMDLGDTESYSLTSRIEPETFKENMTNLLCECTSYSDVVGVVRKMRTDPVLQGKDKLPPVEFPTMTAYGATGIIIDAYGNVSQNVSSEVAAAEANFTKFITQNVDTYETLASFYGDVTGNVLTVNVMAFGEIKAGEEYILEGDDVPDGTSIVSYSGGKGQEGTYFINTNYQSKIANSYHILYSVIANPEQPEAGGGGGGGGGGLGNLIGMIPGQNMFGEASKLMGEILPALDPKSSQKVQQMIQKIQQQTNKSLGDLAAYREPIDAFKKYVKKFGG